MTDKPIVQQSDREVAAVLANRICGCATKDQHKADIEAILEYRIASTTALEAERDALAKRVEELEKDASRYRWLRDHSCPPHNFYISVPDEFHGIRYTPAEVDAYIDAAITAMRDTSHG